MIMRAIGKDIIELFGYRPDDQSNEAAHFFNKKMCPFVFEKPCSKTNHDQTIVYGTCAVSGTRNNDIYDEVIICPKRLYAENYRVFGDVIAAVWGDVALVVGGSLDDLMKKAAQYDECVVAFGQNSGREITVNSGGKLSIDWVVQRYQSKDGTLSPVDFVGIEIQSIDTTGNYRDNYGAYANMKVNGVANLLAVPVSKHGLNWANVHKRLIPQIIRKGKIYEESSRCVGFFFILPQKVYQKFEEVLGHIVEEPNCSRSNLTVLTYELGPNVKLGEKRELVRTGIRHMGLVNISQAFSKQVGEGVTDALDRTLTSLFIR
jgi:hypothetical protein